MFWKILQWVQIVISLIREAEDQLGSGRGREKRMAVEASAVRELELLATAAQIGSCDSETLAKHAGQLIDGAVGIMNCFGVFAGSAARPPVPAAAGSSGDPPAGQ